MRRKLVQQGTSTLMISLPSKWIHKLNLKKGDEIAIEQRESGLIISKDEISTKKETTIKLTTPAESAIRTAIVNAYRAGYDVIAVNFNNEEQYKHIAKITKEYLIGFDIAEKSQNKCVLESITGSSEGDSEVILRKIFYNIRSLIDNTEQRLLKKTNFEDYQDVASRIQQYDNFCRRLLAKNDPLGTKTNLFWSFLTLLIHGQREFYHLNKFLDKTNVTFKETVFFSNVKKIFSLLEEGYLKKDFAKLEEIHDLEKKVIYKEFYTLVQKNQKENIVLYHLASAIRNFYLASSPLIGLLLESSASK